MACTLKARAWIAVAALTLVMTLLIFSATGTLRYWEAWVFLAIIIPTSILTTIDC